MKTVNIVGSGFGGLAAAIRLQSSGFQVNLFEKNSMVGGHASQLKIQGYTFDMGPSLVTAPDIIQDVFSCAGRKMEDYMELMPLDPFYRIYFADGSFMDYSGDGDKMKAQMAKFSEKDAGNYDRFMDYIKKLYKAVITDGLGARPFDLNTMVQFLPKALRLNALLPVYSVVKRYFEDPRNRFAFSFHPLFIGGSPFRSPSVYLMIPYLEKAGGVWFTRGGMYSVVAAMEKLFKEIGGKVHLNSEVSDIPVINGRAAGVVADGQFHAADAVISNAHFAHTYSQLIKPEHRRKWRDSKVKGQAYGMSTFLIYLGVKKQYPQLLHHTLILSERYRELVKDIFDRKVLAEDFSMYLHVPSRTDENMAPEGCESMYVLIPVPNLEAAVDWEKEATPFANKILRFLEEEFGMDGLRDNIDVMELFTPEDFRKQRNNHLGSAWGIEPKLTQTASFRPHNRSEDIKGLYLVGANTHPGAGVPGVLLTAQATEKAIRDDMNVPVKNSGKARQVA